MQNLAASFFSLIKSNFGAFKSEKQAAFLLSKCADGVYTSYQFLHFGEYETRTTRNTASVSFSFYVNAEGVYKVEKTTSKGTMIHWEKTEEYKNKAEQQAKARREAIEADNQRQRDYNAKMRKEIQAEIDKDVKDLEEYKNDAAQKAVINNARLWDRIVATIEEQIENKKRELEKYQD